MVMVSDGECAGGDDVVMNGMVKDGDFVDYDYSEFADGVGVLGDGECVDGDAELW